ncbi:MAG: agmatinase [Candidatus Micrarchaeia archaeon]
MHVLNQLPPYNLFGIEDQSYEKAKIAVLPIPYDSTSTYKAGSRDGPAAIIDASRNLELYDYETKEDISRLGIYTLEPMAPDLSSPEKMVDNIGKETTPILQDGKIPLLLGGEHTIAIGSVQALSKLSKRPFSVLHFDAHSDSRDEIYGAKYCHACVLARIAELGLHTYSVGIRSIDKESADRYGKSMLFRDEMHGMSMDSIVKKINSNINEDIYLTFDFDVLDPSIMPSTGTPEPDGLTYYETMQILKGVLPKKNVIGMDFTEFSPIPGMVSPDFLAAKLIYQTIGLAYSKLNK